MTQGDGLTSATYNAMDKPTQIVKSGKTLNFTYGPQHMRFKQVNGSVTTFYSDKLYEEEVTGTKTTWRAYIDDIAVISQTTGEGTTIRYTHRDRLGSARVFTDHEHLDNVELIHMNGRVYDYNLGRFMSVDLVIQSPTNSQSINPYSYIMNNPLSGTDPTGYAAGIEKEEVKVSVIGSRFKRTVGEKTTVTTTAFLGHADLSTMQVYAHVSMAKLKEVASSGSTLREVDTIVNNGDNVFMV